MGRFTGNEILHYPQNKFIVWSVDQNQKLLEVESGGGHRSWDFILNDGCHGNLARLLYIKAREVVVKEILLQSHQLVVKVCNSK